MTRSQAVRPPRATPTAWRRIAATLRTCTALAGTVAAAPAAAQTIRYAQPEPGAYPCVFPTVMPTTRYDAFARRWVPSSYIHFAPSPIGTLMLEPGGRYRLTANSGHGAYAARAEGAIAFSGSLGGPQFTSGYSAKNGTFEIWITYRKTPNSESTTTYCHRQSAAAQMTGGPSRDQSASAGAAFPRPLVVVGILLGRHAADARVTDATERFGPADTVYASVHTTGSASAAILVARWTFEDGQVVQESSQSIAPSGDAYTEFHIWLPSGFPKGKYAVEIFLNGKSAGARGFGVQ